MEKSKVIVIGSALAAVVIAGASYLYTNKKPEVLSIGASTTQDSIQKPVSAPTKELARVPANAESPDAIVNQVLKDSFTEDSAAKQEDEADASALQSDSDSINAYNEVTND